MISSAIRGAAMIPMCVMILMGLAPSISLAQAPSQEAKPKVVKSRTLWRVSGKVTDSEGRPFPGVEVVVYCGYTPLAKTWTTTTGSDGRYDLEFGPGFRSMKRQGPSIQGAIIWARKPGYFEANLSRQGDCIAADGMPDEAQLKYHGHTKEQLFLPDRPIELNFVMRPAARVLGRLVDEQGSPLVGYGVGLGGPDPPSMGATRGFITDAEGRFTVEEIPTTFRYQFVVRKSDPQPPWNDSWAGAALRFETPPRGDLHAWFGKRELKIDEFILKVAGPGVQGREAVPIAGNVGKLDLTGKADGIQVSETLIAARSATLTLRNILRPDLGSSLIPETVPVDREPTSPSQLVRTRPDKEGNFTISFQNPRGVDLEQGKHQVVFQVFVGTSKRPIREKIFRQLEPKSGRYEVPVKISPEWLDDSRVSLTFLTIQPEHDAWIRSFFHEGKGTSYKGMWAEDFAPIPAIPYAREGKESRPEAR